MVLHRRKSNPLIFLAVALAVFLTAVWQQRADSHKGPDRAVSAEQAQIDATLALIERGGPFPHAKDGTVFGNREGRLPAQPHGYYREYTVPTPGAKNRGARRIVRGKGGETYYTRDHYRTFERIDE
jgi:ribonuclease T1